MSKLSNKVIGVDVGAKFLTVSFTDNVNQDQVFNIQNNQRSILSFSRNFPQKIIVWLSKPQVIIVVAYSIFLWIMVLNQV